MRIFSTFTGIGGFEIGIHNAYRSTFGRGETDSEGNEGSGFQPASGESISSPDGRPSERSDDIFNQRPLCVGYSEIDKYASSVYERHYPNVRNYGDITKINADELPDFDCLVGGFPCQAFSIAGKRRGFEDTRGTLFFDLARILKAKTPRLFVFENVKGLLSHDNGNTFKTIIAAIDELGYDCQWQVLNSKNHGVPQNRERVIIVGHLRGTPRPEVFPITGNNQETANEVTDKGVIVDLTRREPTSYRERKDGRAGTLDANYYKGLANQERPGVVQIGNIYKNGHNSASGRVYDSEGISPTLDTAQGGNRQPKVIDELKIRRLTPIECERLQAFPDDWTKYGKDGELISDTQRYKMCGNAVTTNVIRDVFERILNGGRQ